MSTVKAINFQHPSASAANITLAADGTVSGGIPSPNRNLLYNGAMQVSQRGTSTASITTASYNTADRWYVNISNLGTWTQSVENDAPTGSGFRKSLKMLCTTADASPAAADFAFVKQGLEGQDLQRIAKGTSSAQQLTASFWVKSNVTGTYILWLYDVDNNRSVSASYTISASATWERKTITFPADTTGAFDNDNVESLSVYWGLAVGSNRSSGTLGTTWAANNDANTAVGQTNLAAATNNYWQITGVQLEVGSQATAFEFKSFGQDLAECQRYYEKSYSVDVAPATVTDVGNFGFKVAYTSSYHWIGQPQFRVTKRATPSITLYSNATGASGKARLASGSDVNAATLDVGQNGFITYINNSSVSSDIQVTYHWIASIEL